MLSLDISKMPQGLKSFISEGQINFQALESKPNKLLKFYLHYLKVERSTPLTQQIFTATKQEMQRVLLAQYDAKTLSDYHFAKFLFHNPDLLEGREAEVVEIVSKFADQLNPSSDAKTLRRASKILEGARANPALGEQCKEILGRISHVGEYRVTSSDGEEFALDLSLWTAKVEAWRPWLTGDRPQVRPVSCSLKQLMEIDQFLKTSILPDLTLDGFMELYQKAEEILFPDLAKACAEKIKEKLSHETIGEILPLAVECNYGALITICLDYISRNKLTPAEVKWSDQGGLSVEMTDISQNPSDLSTYLFSKAKNVHLNFRVQKKVSDRIVIFPEATCVQFYTEPDTFEECVNDDGLFDIEKTFKNFSTCFPKAEEITISYWRRVSGRRRVNVSLIKDMTQGTWVFKDQELFLRIKADNQAAALQAVPRARIATPQAIQAARAAAQQAAALQAAPPMQQQAAALQAVLRARIATPQAIQAARAARAAALQATQQMQQQQAAPLPMQLPLPMQQLEAPPMQQQQAAPPMQQQQAAQQQSASAPGPQGVPRQRIIDAIQQLKEAGSAGLPLSKPQTDNALRAVQDLRALDALGLLDRIAIRYPAAYLAIGAVTASQQQTASADSTSGAPQTTSDDASASGTKREAPETREENISDDEPLIKKAKIDKNA